MGGGDGWATGDALYLSIRLLVVAMSPRSASDRPRCPDKARGPKAVVLAMTAMVLAVPLFSQPASWNRTIHKLHVYLVWDTAITF